MHPLALAYPRISGLGLRVVKCNRQSLVYLGCGLERVYLSIYWEESSQYMEKCSKPPSRYFSASDPSDWHRATSKMLLTNADRTSWKDLFFAVALDDIGEPPLDVFKLQIFQRTHTETKDTSAYCLKSQFFFYPGSSGLGLCFRVIHQLPG
jgi:hypothetical protein